MTSVSTFDRLPDTAFIRAAHLVRDPKHPERANPLDISMATLWRYVADGRFPQPARLSAGMTVWHVGEVRQWIKDRTAGCKAAA